MSSYGRDELYREALQEREDELLREGKSYSEAIRIARKQIKHDNDDGGE